MKIDSAHIKNFKNVKELHLEPGGQSFVVTGGNGDGKSSVIQALLGTLSGERPKVVVGPDGKIAEVIVNIKGDNQSYHIAAKFQQDEIKGRAEGKIVITDQNGDKVGIKAFRYLIGNATFDVERDFLQKSKSEQVEFLKKVTGKAAEINRIELERKQKFDERTDVNRRVRDLEGELKGVDIDSKLKFIDPEPVKREMNSIAESLKKYQYVQQEVEKCRVNIESFPAKAQGIDDEIKALEEKIAALKSQKKQLEDSLKEDESKLAKGEAWLDTHPEPSIEALTKSLDEIEENNKKVEARDRVLEKHKNLKAQKELSLKLTGEIEKLDSDKKEIIKNSNLPVEGLTFNDDGVFLDGLPFEVGQINTAKIQEVGFMLFKSLQNNIKVMKLSMNDLDKETYERILAMAEESDTQVIFERVSWDSNGEPEIKFVEEYL